MKIQMFWKLAAISVALGLGWARADHTREVNIYSFLTPAGEKLTPPTAGHPATCLLMNGGYHEEGALVAGEKPVAPGKIEPLVLKALATAHYMSYVPEKFPHDATELDYIIVYSWGYMNPSEDSDPSSDDSTTTVTFNGASMLALVAGDSISRMTPNTMDWEDAMAAAEDSRYFVLIAAYSPAAYINKHERKLLWRAQMSLPSNGITLDQSVGALVDSSVGYLGRQTNTPKQVFENMDRPSHVILGTPETKEYLPATGSSKPNATQKP